MPTTIGSSPQGYDLRFSAHGISGLEYNGNIYVCVTEGAEFDVGDLGIHILKSTDGGTTWSQVGGIVSGSLEVRAYATCQDANFIYILATDTFNGSGATETCSTLVGWKFDMDSDTLSGFSLTSPPTIYKMWHGPTPSGFQPSKCVGLSLIRKGTDSFWFVYQGTPETIGGEEWSRLYVADLTGGTFSGATLISGQSGITFFTQGPVALDGSNNLHMILADNGRNYYHIAMSSGGTFGTFQTIETACFFAHLEPPEEISNLVHFDASGDKIAFLGVNNRFSSLGDLVLYHAAATLSPTWSTEVVTATGTGSPVVVNATISSGLATSLGIIDGNLHALWTVCGHTPNWSVNEREGKVVSKFASLSDLTSWSGETNFAVAPSSPDVWSAAQVNSWVGATYGLEIFVGFSGVVIGESDPIELSLFDSIPASTADFTVTKADTLTLTDAAVANFITGDGEDVSDAIMFSDGPPQLGLSVISNPADNVVPPPPGTGTPGPDVPPVGLSTCIFEFYEMQKPEDVEVLPVPKRFDQLGPMRFDKIGKIFALRIRLIMNGTTTSLPYAIYGDDSETSPHLNSPLYSDSFPVRPGFDNVYEIQLPKSVNTDIFRLTLGPVADSFHRYNVIVKVHISGMQGQAKWLPIR